VKFDHEKLIVYQRALEFIVKINPILNSNFKSSVIDNLDRASTSVVLNIAEGTGKYSPKDKSKFYDIARGSALECAACIDILLERKKMSVEDAVSNKNMLIEIVSMLFGLIKSISDRVYEAGIDYNLDI